MGRLSDKLRNLSTGEPGESMIGWYCPACESMHAIPTGHALPNGARWQWDGNVDAPTVTPSVNVHPDGPGRCHFFLTAGRLQFCGDSQHGLAGQTVDLPDLPGWLR